MSFSSLCEAGVPTIRTQSSITPPGALLVCISSPYARRGALWDAYRRHYGQDGDPVLVWQADTRSMNPTVDERVIADAYEQDEAAAAAEYGAEFRRDVESFIVLRHSGPARAPPALAPSIRCLR